MWVSFLHFKRWIGSLIPSPGMLNGLILAVSCPSSCNTQHLSLSVIFPYLLCIIFIIRSWFLIPDIFHFGALLWLFSFLAWCLFLTIFVFFSEPHFFGPFSLCSRWNFHWLKPDVACTSVSTWSSQLRKMNHLQPFSISLLPFYIHPSRSRL